MGRTFTKLFRVANQLSLVLAMCCLYKIFIAFAAISLVRSEMEYESSGDFFDDTSGG